MTVTKVGLKESDNVLLHRIVERDGEALAILYDRHAHWIYPIILRIVHEQASAQAILIDTFWQLWQQADELPREGSVGMWLLRIARDRSVAHLRRQTTGCNPLWRQLSAHDKYWNNFPE